MLDRRPGEGGPVPAADQRPAEPGLQDRLVQAGAGIAQAELEEWSSG